MANWKEGIDWITDPTGATALANHSFIAPWGDDATGDGSHTNPWQTLEKGAADGASTLILYTGVYTLSGNNTYNHTYRGDGLVIVEGNGYDFSHTAAGWQKVVLRNGNLYSNNNRNNYGIVGIDLLLDDTASPQFTSCIFINSTFALNGSLCAIGHSIFINCDLTLSSGFGEGFEGSGNNLYTNGGFHSVYFDTDCTINIAGSPKISNSNLRATVTGAGSFAETGTILNTDPLYNNPEGGDFSSQAGSPHVGSGSGSTTKCNDFIEELGGSKTNIGATTFGQSYFYGSDWLDSIIGSSANLSYNVSTGEIEVSSDVVVESGEFQEANLRYLPKLNLCGFPDVSNDPLIALAGEDRLIYECAWAGLDGVYGDWEKFRFGEVPTIDTLGNYNGETDYRWGELEKIIMFKRKYRFTFRSSGL